MGKIFGGSKSKSKSVQESGNKAYEPLLAAYQPLLNYANDGAASFKAFMGGDRTGFDNYLKNSSFDFDQDRGEGAIGTALSSRGLRNSGAMLKKLSAFNNDLRNQYSGQYLDRLAQLMGVGTGAAQIIGGTGGYSKGESTSSSSSKPGLGSLVGTGLSMAAGGFGGASPVSSIKSGAKN